MVKINLYVTEEQKATLDKLSEKTGVPTSEFIRRAIDAALLEGSKKGTMMELAQTHE
jgi:predicted DNA-binding protein